jgi:two-component system, chemotaxis family, chemotaxis protein CheY
LKILSVDDSATMRKIIALALKDSGHSVAEAENGKAALDMCSKEAFDFILLDINMPEMNGIEFLTARKSNPGLLKVPVVVLTTQDEESLKKQAFELGAVGFIAKPFQKESVLAAISKAAG